MEDPKATRAGYGDGLAELGEARRDVVALDADLAKSTKSIKFKEKFPARFFEMGISEQDMVATAAGFALAGKIPYASSFACFLTGRAYDQIRTSVCYSNVNVKLAGSHAGLMTGEDGATHQALEDISLMRGLPNMKVIVPADYFEAKIATKKAADIPGPVYLRLARAKTPIYFNDNYKFTLGKGVVMKSGSDVAIIACGAPLQYALEAAERLKKDKIEAAVVNMPSIKPLDSKLVSKMATQAGAIVTVEDHSIYGGLGSAVAEVMAEEGLAPVERVGMKDVFGESGKGSELYKKYGLDSEGIINAVKIVIGKRK
ncbi:MAG: transketolase family protein [Candidatus Diapherotrites archaeon]